jgi:hypothetical protein
MRPLRTPFSATNDGHEIRNPGISHRSSNLREIPSGLAWPWPSDQDRRRLTLSPKSGPRFVRIWPVPPGGWTCYSAIRASSADKPGDRCWPARRSRTWPSSSVSPTPPSWWRRQALIDAVQVPALKSCEADRPAQAHRCIKELEDELKLVNAAGALFNECQVISPRGVAACPRTEQLELLRTTGLPTSRAEPFRPGRTRRPPQRLAGPACRIYRTVLLVSAN